MWPLSSRATLREKVFIKHEEKKIYIFKNIISNLRLPFVRLFTPSIIQIFQSCSFPLFHCFPYTCIFSLQQQPPSPNSTGPKYFAKIYNPTWRNLERTHCKHKLILIKLFGCRKSIHFWGGKKIVSLQITVN